MLLPPKNRMPFETVPVVPALLPPDETPAVNDPVFGPTNEMLAPPAADDPDSVTLLPPKNRIPLETVPVVPAVFPPDEMPPVNAPPAPPTIETLAPPAPDDCESVMLAPPYMSMPFETVPVVPAVLPPEETPAVKVAPPLPPALP